MNPQRTIRPDSTGGRTIALLKANGPMQLDALATALGTTDQELERNLAYPVREGVIKRSERPAPNGVAVLYALPVRDKGDAPSPPPAADLPPVPTFTKAAARAASKATAPAPKAAPPAREDQPAALKRFGDLGKAIEKHPGLAVDAIPEEFLTQPPPAAGRVLPTPPAVFEGMARALDATDVQSYVTSSQDMRLQILSPAPGPLVASVANMAALTEATPATPAPAPGPMIKAWPTSEPKTQAANDERADVRDLVREAAQMGGFETVNEALGANASRELLSSAVRALEVKTLDIGWMESGAVLLVLDSVLYMLPPPLAKRLTTYMDRVDL